MLGGPDCITDLIWQARRAKKNGCSCCVRTVLKLDVWKPLGSASSQKQILSEVKVGAGPIGIGQYAEGRPSAVRDVARRLFLLIESGKAAATNSDGCKPPQNSAF